MLRIYLSGSIKKGRSDDRGDDAFWTAEHEAQIRGLVGADTKLLNPAKSPIRRNDYFVNYGCDLFLVGHADVVLADLRCEKGIGVGAELMYAHVVRRPVIGWLPPNSYYRRDKIEDVFGEDLTDWTHPFAYGLCDIIVDSLEEACAHINKMRADSSFGKNSRKSPDKAIKAFLEEYNGAFEDGWSGARRHR
jgi:hypothetical protein